MSQQSVQDWCLEQIRDQIVRLRLPGVREAEVQIRKMPSDDTKRPIPGITVSQEKEIEGTGTSGRMEWGYPALVTIVRGTARSSREGMPAINVARHEIVDEFHEQRLDGTPPNGALKLKCTVVPSDPLIVEHYIRDSEDVSQLVIIGWFWRTRKNRR
jgi:hypothetical protein